MKPMILSLLVAQTINSTPAQMPDLRPEQPVSPPVVSPIVPTANKPSFRSTAKSVVLFVPSKTWAATKWTAGKTWQTTKRLANNPVTHTVDEKAKAFSAWSKDYKDGASLIGTAFGIAASMAVFLGAAR